MSGAATRVPTPGPVLLATKFLPPVPRRSHLRRERLHRRIARASSTPITLLSAPAGFGKTSLLAGWLRELDGPWAWLSIDGQDNDPERLWAHVIAALQSLAGSVGDGALVELRRHAGRGPVEGWLTPLINDLAVASAPESYLVVDDLHLLTEADQRAGIGVLARHLPGWLHLVLSTRADPPLPLPRLRADGLITEVREADLRFVAGEASSFLAASGMNQLDSGQVDLLLERTEGWAAGLQLAAITLGDHPAGTPLDNIVGGLRPFTDYLITEVVDHQTTRMRDFLYATSIVDRVNPSLAHVLSGDPDADRMLRQAEREGLFLMALDGQDEWYRYHHLFAEALRHELRVRWPEAAVSAHTAAACWFEDRGDAATSLEHWLAAGRPEEALRLAVDVGFALVDRGQAAVVEGITRRIPASVASDDPARQLNYGLLHLVFEPETFLAWVAQAAETIARLVDPDDDLVTQYLTVRSIADLSVGAWDDAFDHAVDAVGRRHAPGQSVGYVQRAKLQVIRAAGWLECLDEAEAAFRASVDDPRTPGALRTVVAPSAWALAAALGGRIDDADHCSRTAATAAREQGVHNTFSAEDILLTRALVAREHGDPEAAAQAIETLRDVAIPANFSLRAVAETELALARLDQGRVDEARNVLDGALQVRRDGALGRLVVGRIDAAWSAVDLACGDLAGAKRAAQRMPLGLWRDVALARSLLAAGASVEAESTLRALSPATPRQDVVVGILRALSVADRNVEVARDYTVAALQAAAAVGLHHTVVTAGPGVQELVEKSSWAVPATWVEHVRRTLAMRAGGPTVGRVPRLVEQPTARERDAVRFLSSRLTIPEIARELGVSPNTLKTHLRGLYRKLDVTSREEAVIVARELGILR